MTKVAIIGAGLAGLALAQFLKGQCEVRLFDKSRGVGGRMATRYRGNFEFDHGAQYFTAKSDAFRTFLSPLIEEGLVASWAPAIAQIDGNRIQEMGRWDDTSPHYVAVPRMNALCKKLAESQSIHLQARIVSILKTGATWQLQDEAGKSFEGFDWVVCTAPAPQSAALMPQQFVHHHILQSITMKPCHTLMLGFEKPIDLAWQAVRVVNSDISWMALNSNKPGRPQGASMVIHANNDWSEKHVDDDLSISQSHLLTVASQIVGADLTKAAHMELHRWRYAIAEKQPHQMLMDPQNQLAAIGDWCVEGRVEGAFTSAAALFEKLQPILSE